MSVRCGHCSTKGNPVDHETVAQVRLCAERGKRSRSDHESGAAMDLVAKPGWEAEVEAMRQHQLRLAEANRKARETAEANPRWGYVTLTSIKVNGEWREARHETPCVCGSYDKCSEFRLADAQHAPTHNAGLRAQFRAYND